MIFQHRSASFELRRRRRSIQVIGKQQTPRLTVIQRNPDVTLVEDDAVAFVGCLYAAILKAVGHRQDNALRLVAHKLAALIQQPLQDGFLLSWPV